MKLVDDRWQVIKNYVKGKDILDIGCVSDPSAEPNLWLHGLIKRKAKSLVGIDANYEGVKYLKNRGYNIIYGDAEDPNLNLDKKFDVVHAGEVIEHLSNQGVFIENIKKHLKKDGILIISTPNAHDIAYLLNRLIRRIKDDDKIFRYHLVWHSYGTLKHLLKKHGFSIVDYWYVNSICNTWRRKMVKAITYFFNDFSESILAIAKLNECLEK